MDNTKLLEFSEACFVESVVDKILEKLFSNKD